MIPSIAPLRNVAQLLALIDRVQHRSQGLPGLAVFYGPSGWGKTTATTVAMNQYQAHCVQVKSCWTPTFFLQAIMDEIGLKKVKGGVPGMVHAVGTQLAITDRPLIIDDAQYLEQRKMIQLVRDIHETSHSPVILVGEEQLPQTLTKWENIHNRALEHKPALPCNIKDAEKLAEIYSPDVKIARDLLVAIVEASSGSIRRVATNIDTARELAKTSGRTDADLGVWGERPFVTGEAPAVRKPVQLKTKPALAKISKIGGAA